MFQEENISALSRQFVNLLIGIHQTASSDFGYSELLEAHKDNVRMLVVWWCDLVGGQQ